MALTYDFDMVAVVPPGLHDDAALGDFLDRAGLEHRQGANVVALFRDPATVAALARAPQAVQDYLAASTFGTGTHHSGAPAGRYPAADESARILVIEALTENIARFDLPPPGDMQPKEGEFHLPSFFAAVMSAEPMAPGALASEALSSAPLAPEAVADAPVTVDVAGDPDAAPAGFADTRTEPDAAPDAIAAVLAAAAPESPAPNAAAPDAAPAPAGRRDFRRRLPPMPRWLMAGGAFAVLGAVFASSKI